MDRPYIPALLIAVFALTQGIDGITYKDNRYELNVALSEYSLDVPAAERNQFVKDIENVITQASRFLFEVTDYRMYFGTVNILIPRSWVADIMNYSPTTTFSYATADIRVEETKLNEEGDVIDYIRTKNPKPCGQPGDHIIVPPQFINNTTGWTEKYGDRVKTFIHEFARFRYGVFEEYGFESDSDQLFPYSFRNARGHLQVTGCNNTEIKGSVHQINLVNKMCTVGEPSCRFFPDVNSDEGPTTSLMFMHYLKTANKFCDSSNHDKTAPNRQNYFCRNRSIKTVIESSRDFTLVNPLPSTTNTIPVFNIRIPTAQAIYVVFDVSTHDTPSGVEFNAAKTRVSNDLITKLSLLTNKVLMGVATIGSTFKEEQSPIQVQGNENILRSSVEKLARSGNLLNLKQGLLEVGKKLTPFGQLSGSIVLLFKFNSRTDNPMSTEGETIATLNSRSSRLVTFELLKTTSDQKSLERPTLLTNGQYFWATNQNYNNNINSTIDSTLDMAKELRFQNRRVTLVLRSINVAPDAPFKSWVRNDFSAQLEVNFYVNKSIPTANYNIKVKTYNFSSPEHTQSYLSWGGDYKIHTFKFDSSSAANHSYEITSISPLELHLEAAEILSENAPLHLGGGGLIQSKPIEVEITTSGDNGFLNMGLVSSEDLSFLIYAAIRKGASIVANSLVRALVHGSSAGTTEVELVDNGTYPDILAGDGIYSGVFKPDAISTLTTYYISARMQGYSRSNTIGRSLPTNQEYYCCGSLYSGDTYGQFYQRYTPYAASLQVVGAATYKERPQRITDLKLTNYSEVESTVTLSWTVPKGNVDSFKIAYGEDSTSVIDARGLIPATANLIDEALLVSGTLQPQAPDTVQTITTRLNWPALSPPPLYFTIASVKNGVSESYPAPMVYKEGEPGATTAAPTTTTTSPTTTLSTSTETPTIRTSPATTTSTTTAIATSESTTSTIITSTTDDPNSASLKSGSFAVVITAIVFLCPFF